MTHQGITLQGYNNDLLKRLEELRNTRQDLTIQIASDDEKIKSLQYEIRNLSSTLALVNESMAKKLAARVEIDKTMAETEINYSKVVDRSQNLIGALKKEGGTVKQKITK